MKKQEAQLVTPEMAAELLKLNTNNRNLRTRHVSFLIKELKAGRWRLSYDPIVISTEGVLLNGQHRLTAILQSGVPALLSVVTGAEPDDFLIIDTNNVPRKLADVVQLAGIPNAAKLNASVRWLLAARMADAQGMLVESCYTLHKIGTEDVLDFVNECPDLYSLFQRAILLENSHNKLLLKGAFNGALLFCAEKVGTDIAEEFFFRVVRGIELKDNSPEITLIRVYQREVGKGNRSASVLLATSVHYFIKWLEGQSVKNPRSVADYPRINWFKLRDSLSKAKVDTK